MPETSARFLVSIFDSIRACAKQLTVVPIPHPGHQMCGMRSERRNGSTGLIGVGLMSVVIGQPPGSQQEFLPDDARCLRHGERGLFWLFLRRRVLLHAPSVRDSIPARQKL